jgi:hypothetical protein
MHPGPGDRSIHSFGMSRRPDFHSHQADCLRRYVATLPAHRSFERQVHLTNGDLFLQRENACELRPSQENSTIAGVYTKIVAPIKPKTKILDYPGFLMTNAEYDANPYAVYTAVALDVQQMQKIDATLPDSQNDPASLVLVGDPRCLGANIVCVRGPTHSGGHAGMKHA